MQGAVLCATTPHRGLLPPQPLLKEYSMYSQQERASDTLSIRHSHLVVHCTKNEDSLCSIVRLQGAVPPALDSIAVSFVTGLFITDLIDSNRLVNSVFTSWPSTIPIGLFDFPCLYHLLQFHLMMGTLDIFRFISSLLFLLVCEENSIEEKCYILLGGKVGFTSFNVWCHFQ